MQKLVWIQKLHVWWWMTGLNPRVVCLVISHLPQGWGAEYPPTPTSPPPNTHTLHCFRSWSATYYSFFTAWRYGLCVIVCVFVARPLLPKRHVQDVPLGPSDCPLSAPCCHHLPAVFPQVKRFQPEVHCFSSSSLLSVCDDTGELSFPNSYSLLLWMKKY